MFAQGLIYTHINSKNQEEMFDFLFDQLKEKDMVFDIYKEKIKERELSYPTGIQLSQIGVAIPHANAEYAKKNGFVILTSEEGILFRDMESGDDVIVKVIIAVVFSDANKHIEHLQSLSNILQNEELLIEISKCTNANDIYELVK